MLCQKDAGDEANTLEGAASPRVYEDRLYVTLSLAGVIKTMPLNSNDPCEGNLRDRVSPLGQVPNDVLVEDDYLWVVHSGDNVVTGYPQHSDDDPVELLCPVGSNPWHMALHPNGREIAVTEWKGQGVTPDSKRAARDDWQPHLSPVKCDERANSTDYSEGDQPLAQGLWP